MAAAGPGPGAGAGPGAGLCPFCRRPFKRLRAHLPHCKAAPPAASPEPPAGPRSRSVRDVARSLDLQPEEAAEVAGKLRKGVKVVIEKHRARVVREKEPRSRGGGSEPGPAPQRPKSAQSPEGKDSPSHGALGNATAGPKGEKRRSKATKALQEAPESGNSPGELVRQEGRDKCTAGEEQLDLGLAWKPPESLRVSLGLAGHGQGRSRNELGRLQGAPQPPGLALLLSPQKAQPQKAQPQRAQPQRAQPQRAQPQRAQPQRAQPQRAQPQRAQPQRAQPRSSATALEWFPALYPDYEGLRILPGTRFHEDARMAAETPKGGLAQGQPGPLSERPLMEVRLGELHAWISTCNFSPQGLLGAAQRAWSSYCAKYIHVKQGGPAGISMLLAGYCLLSYGWNYQHLKRHRWRKYH